MKSNTPFNESTKSYLSSMGKHKLLTPTEEIELSRLVNKYVRIEKAKTHLARQYNFKESDVTWSLLSQYLKQLIEELQEEHSKGFEARQRMINSNLRLVVSIAKGYMNRGLSFPDLIQEGIIGLINGLERFDETFGCRVSTYSSWWVNHL